MGVRPVVSLPQISPAEMEQMVSRAGLVLNSGQMGDLVLAWRQVVQLVALIPRDRPLADDFAVVFRLPPPRAKKSVPRKPAPAAKRKPPPAPKRARLAARAAPPKRRKAVAGRR